MRIAMRLISTTQQHDMESTLLGTWAPTFGPNYILKWSTATLAGEFYMEHLTSVIEGTCINCNLCIT